MVQIAIHFFLDDPFYRYIVGGKKHFNRRACELIKCSRYENFFHGARKQSYCKGEQYDTLQDSIKFAIHQIVMLSVWPPNCISLSCLFPSFIFQQGIPPGVHWSVYLSITFSKSIFLLWSFIVSACVWWQKSRSDFILQWIINLLQKWIN